MKEQALALTITLIVVSPYIMFVGALIPSYLVFFIGASLGVVGIISLVLQRKV